MLNNKPTTLFTTAYLAPIAYYAAAIKSGTMQVEQWEHYHKQTYRNRCRIAAASGVLNLNIPVERTGDKILMRDVRIAYQANWQRQHWQSLVSAYNTTPFFEYYVDDFEPFYKKRWTFLLDYNMNLHTKILKLLNAETEVSLTSCYQPPTLPSSENDLRDAFCPKREEQTGEKYHQVFEQKYGFLPNLSILDLLFNMGNEALLILTNTK